MIQIAVINESTAITDADAQTMMAALSQQWNMQLAGVWGLEYGSLAFVPKGQAPTPGTWWIVFLDDSDQAGALAYHDVTNEGLPISKVFVKTLLSDGASVSVGASHEMCEMAVDPTINLAAQAPDGTFWAYEVCDPFEDDQYGYKIGDVLVSDFCTPAWFGFVHSAGMKVDFMGHGTAPFQVMSGGYAQSNNGSGWTQVNGADVKASHALTAPRGSRRDRRMRLVWPDARVMSSHQF